MGSLVLALTSAAAYGVSDFVGGLASRRTAVMAVLVASYPVSTAIAVVAALLTGGVPTGPSLYWGALSGLAMAAAAWTYFLALRNGPMSIISPFTALLAAAVPLGVGLTLGERPDALSLAGIALALVAVVCVSLSPHADTAATHPFTRQVAILAFAAGLSFALSFVFTGQIESGTGLWPLVAARGTATVAVLLIAASRAGLHLPPVGPALWLSVSVGLLDSIAHLTMLFALQQGLLSVGSVVISLFPAVTVLLAVTILSERLTPIQMTGLALGAGAIVLIGL